MKSRPVVIVTGAAGGIGKATCDLLSQNDWHVVGTDILDIPSEDSLEMRQGDASSEAFVEKTIDYVYKAYGRIDGIVTNAAIQLNKTIQETSYEDWNKILTINLSSTFLWTKHGIAPLKETKGSIVSISSVHAVATTGQISAYAATKGGLMAFTRAAALELAEYQIRVNTVLPGATDTPMLRHGFERGHLKDETVDDQLEELAKRHPLKRIGQAREISEAIHFLLDNTRSGFITGQGIIIDGGATIKLSTE